MNEIGSAAQGGQRVLNARLRPKEYRMSALSGAMGEQANMPYFRGVEPMMKQPNTLFGDLMTGAGSIGTQYFTTRLPRTGATT